MTQRRRKPVSSVDSASAPSVWDYATIEGAHNGMPIYSFNNIAYVYGQPPDLTPGLVWQEGNSRPARKIRLKKSWEIKHNYNGSESEMSPRTAYNDAQPLLPIHLIDGDSKTVWCSWGSAEPDVRPEWIRIDLPHETEIQSVALVACKDFPQPENTRYGKAFPKEVEILLSKDAWHWDTVYASKDVAVDELHVEATFEPQLAKQILIKASNFPSLTRWEGYVFSIGGVEVRDTVGQNVALVSRGAGVTVSSTSYEMINDRHTQDSLWGPLNYDLGNKWIRIGGDNGSAMWIFTEHEKGKLQVDKRLDEYVADCRRHGVNVILTLDYKGNWIYKNPPRKTDWLDARFHELDSPYNDPVGAAFDSPKEFKAYLKYIDFMVRHFAGRVAYFEIGNEWNNAKIPPVQYVKQIFEPTYEVIKKAYPKARIMLGSPGAGWVEPVKDAVPGVEFPSTMAAVIGCLAMPGVATRIDALGWHGEEVPGSAYADTVRKLKAYARQRGFKGKYFASEIYAGSMEPKGDVRRWSGHCDVTEEAEACYLTQSLILHASFDMEAGPCHPSFTGWAHPQSMMRVSVPSAIVHPCQPKMIYYMWRNIATMMDDFYAAGSTVNFSAGDKAISFQFARPNKKDLLVGAWINSVWEDHKAQLKTALSLPGVRAKRAWAMDIVNGTEQELSIKADAKGTTIKNLVLRAYPLFIRLEKAGK